jgi:hypothetical protein
MSDVWDFMSSASNVFRTADNITRGHTDGCRSISVLVYWCICVDYFVIVLSISRWCMQKELKKLQVIVVVLTHRMAYITKETTHLVFKNYYMLP